MIKGYSTESLETSYLNIKNEWDKREQQKETLRGLIFSRLGLRYMNFDLLAQKMKEDRARGMNEYQINQKYSQELACKKLVEDRSLERLESDWEVILYYYPPQPTKRVNVFSIRANKTYNRIIYALLIFILAGVLDFVIRYLVR